MKRLVAIAAVMVALATGCSEYNDARGKGDAPAGRTDDSPAEVINFPNSFANVATKCDGHGHRVYSNTREAPPVVIDDPTCPGGTPR